MWLVLCKAALAADLLMPVALEERPDDVLRAAIAAAGSDEVLARYPAGRSTGKGTMNFSGIETPFTFERIYHYPGRLWTSMQCDVKGQKWVMVQVANEGVAKQFINGQTIPLTEVALKELQTGTIVSEIEQLYPLITDRKFGIKTDKQLKGSDLNGLVLQVRGHPEFRLAFDRKTGLLIRIGYRVVDPETSKDAELEISFDDFKTVAGMSRPMHVVVTRDGKKLIDFQIDKFTPLERIDPKAFSLEP